jgi:hypothetical protein
MAASDPIIILTPAVDGTSQTALLVDRIFSCALPFLSPREQQMLAQDPTVSDSIKSRLIRVNEPDMSGSVQIGGITLEPLLWLDNREISAAIQETGLFSKEDTDGSELHDVLQGADPAALLKNTFQSRTPAILLDVYYNDKGFIRGRKSFQVSPNITGLQLKSLVIAEFGLDGGFQHYYLTLDGAPFGSRTPICNHPSLAEGSTSGSGGAACLEDVGDRPKASGRT